MDFPNRHILDAVIAAFQEQNLDLRQVTLEQAKDVTFRIVASRMRQQRHNGSTTLNQ